MTSNDTDHEDTNSAHKYPYFYHGDAFVVPMSTAMSVFLLATVAGNVLVIVTILGDRSMKSCRTYQFYMSLAFADLLVGLFGMPFSMVTLISGTWVFGDELCKANGFIMAVGMHVSVHTLTAMGIHEYICLTRPYTYENILVPWKVRALQLYPWVWSILYDGASYAGVTVISYKPGSTQCGPSIPTNLLQIAHSLINTFFNLLLTWIVMSYCYFKIYKEARGHYKRLKVVGTLTRRDSIVKQRCMSLTLVTVLACFLLCWLPYLVYSNVMVFIKNKAAVPLVFNPIAYWFGYMNSACNPIIYALRNPNFREHYKQLLLRRHNSRWNVTPRDSLGSVHTLRDEIRKQSLENGANKNNCRVSFSKNRNEKQEGLTDKDIEESVHLPLQA